MFSPVQIKHEYSAVEDVNTCNRINTSDNSIYPIFINQDVEYKHRHFWEQMQLSSEMPAKSEMHNQQAVFQTEVSKYCYISNGLVILN